MPHDGRRGDEDRVPWAEERRRQRGRHIPFHDVEHHHRDACLLAQHAEHVRGAYIAGAVLAHVHAIEDLPHDQAEGDRPREVGETEHHREAEHLEEDHFFPLKSMISGTPSISKRARRRFSTKKPKSRVTSVRSLTSMAKRGGEVPNCAM